MRDFPYVAKNIFGVAFIQWRNFVFFSTKNSTVESVLGRYTLAHHRGQDEETEEKDAAKTPKHLLKRKVSFVIAHHQGHCFAHDVPPQKKIGAL